MPSRYHQNVKEGIMLWGKRYKKLKKRFKDKDIPINYATKRCVFYYRPDVYFETRYSRLYIFEILDTEREKINEIIANIIQSYLSPNVSRVFFIVPTVDDQGRVANLAMTILGRLSEDLGTSISKLPVKVFYAVIPKDEAKSPEAVRGLLEKEKRILI